jgi:hypothetical protein
MDRKPVQAMVGYFDRAVIDRFKHPAKRVAARARINRGANAGIALISHSKSVLSITPSPS